MCNLGNTDADVNELSKSFEATMTAVVAHCERLQKDSDEKELQLAARYERSHQESAEEGHRLRQQVNVVLSSCTQR